MYIKKFWHYTTLHYFYLNPNFYWLIVNFKTLLSTSSYVDFLRTLYFYTGTITVITVCHIGSDGISILLCTKNSTRTLPPLKVHLLTSPLSLLPITLNGKMLMADTRSLLGGDEHMNN